MVALMARSTAEAHRQPPHGAHERPAGRWLVLGCLVIGFFMILLDTTIVNIAIPSIIDDLGATLDEILWVATAYGRVYAVLLIFAGRPGARAGPRRRFLGGCLLFLPASAGCA